MALALVFNPSNLVNRDFVWCTHAVHSMGIEAVQYQFGCRGVPWSECREVPDMDAGFHSKLTIFTPKAAELSCGKLLPSRLSPTFAMLPPSPRQRRASLSERKNNFIGGWSRERGWWARLHLLSVRMSRANSAD